MGCSISGAVLRGAIAGTIGAWVMDRVTWIPLDREPLPAIAQEKAVRPERLEVSHLLGYRIARALGLAGRNVSPARSGSSPITC